MKAPIKTLKARDVMNKRVLTVREDMTVAELAEFLTEHEISGAPVVNGRGKLVGVASLTDVAAIAAEGPAVAADRGNPEYYVRGWEDELDVEEMRQFHVENAEHLVRDIMTPTIFSVPEETSIPELARTMLAGRIHRMFVTREHKVVGIVTTMDLLKLLCEEPRPRRRGARTRSSPRRPSGRGPASRVR